MVPIRSMAGTLAAIGLFALIVPRAIGAEDAGGEMLKNPGFDEDADGNALPDGWSVSPAAARWREKVYLSNDFENATIQRSNPR